MEEKDELDHKGVVPMDTEERPAPYKPRGFQQGATGRIEPTNVIGIAIPAERNPSLVFAGDDYVAQLNPVWGLFKRQVTKGDPKVTPAHNQALEAAARDAVPYVCQHAGSTEDDHAACAKRLIDENRTRVLNITDVTTGVDPSNLFEAAYIHAIARIVVSNQQLLDYLYAPDVTVAAQNNVLTTDAAAQAGVMTDESGAASSSVLKAGFTEIDSEQTRIPVVPLEVENKERVFKDMRNAEAPLLIDASKLDTLITSVMINKLKLKYPRIEDYVQPGCDTRTSMQQLFLSKTQAFLGAYFRPENPIKGMVFIHSPGAGKTCTGMYVTYWFEQDQSGDPWNIAWITKKKLRTDMLKNAFDQVCSITLAQKRRENAGNFRTAFDDVRRKSNSDKTAFLIEHTNFVGVYSYEQFHKSTQTQGANTGGVEGSGSGGGGDSRYKKYRALRRGPNNDPLYRTLCIFDEADLLFNPQVAREENISEDQVRYFLNAIDRSYKLDKSNSCRVIFMTATPIRENPVDLIRMVDMLLENDLYRSGFETQEQFNTAYRRAIEQGQAPQFENEVLSNFINVARGRISYVDLSMDRSQFPLIRSIRLIAVDMTPVQLMQMNLVYNETFKQKLGDRTDLTARERHLLKKMALGVNLNRSMIDFTGANMQAVRRYAREIAPVVYAAYYEIARLDREDVMQHGHVFKHVLFVDSAETSSVGSVHIVYTVLAALGMNPAIFKNPNTGEVEFTGMSSYIPGSDYEDPGRYARQLPRYNWEGSDVMWNSVGFITNEKFWGKQMNDINWKLPQLNAKKDGVQAMLSIFNDRPVPQNIAGGDKSAREFAGGPQSQSQWDARDNYERDYPKRGNVFGQAVRFLIIDASAREGFDLKDVKYLHLLSQQKGGDFVQTKGRITRRCGNANLVFDGKQWEGVHIIEYRASFPLPVVEKTKRYSIQGAAQYEAEQAQQLEARRRAQLYGGVAPATTKPEPYRLQRGDLVRAYGNPDPRRPGAGPVDVSTAYYERMLPAASAPMSARAKAVTRFTGGVDKGDDGVVDDSGAFPRLRAYAKDHPELVDKVNTMHAVHKATQVQQANEFLKPGPFKSKLREEKAMFGAEAKKTTATMRATRAFKPRAGVSLSQVKQADVLSDLGVSGPDVATKRGAGGALQGARRQQRSELGALLPANVYDDDLVLPRGEVFLDDYLDKYSRYSEFIRNPVNAANVDLRYLRFTNMLLLAARAVSADYLLTENITAPFLPVPTDVRNMMNPIKELQDLFTLEGKFNSQVEQDNLTDEIKDVATKMYQRANEDASYLPKDGGGLFVGAPIATMHDLVGAYAPGARPKDGSISLYKKYGTLADDRKMAGGDGTGGRRGGTADGGAAQQQGGGVAPLQQQSKKGWQKKKNSKSKKGSQVANYGDSAPLI